MRKKLINKLSELPSQFSLKNYEATREFDFPDWLVNIEFRALRRNILMSSPERKLSADYIFRNSLLPESVCKAYESTGLTKHIGKVQIRSQNAFSALAANYYFAGDDRLEKYVEAFKRSGDQPFSEEDYKFLTETPMWKALQDGGIDVDGEVDVSINLQASEDQLVEEFRQWVRATKQEMGIDVPKKAVTKADLKDFSDFQILPYLDLTYWAQSEGVEISNQTLGLALFPHEYEKVLSERVRKVVAPLARKVVTFDYCAYLRSQVVAMNPEGFSKKFVPDHIKVLLDPPKIGQQIAPDE